MAMGSALLVGLVHDSFDLTVMGSRLYLGSRISVL